MSPLQKATGEICDSPTLHGQDQSTSGGVKAPSPSPSTCFLYPKEKKSARTASNVLIEMGFILDKCIYIYFNKFFHQQSLQQGC